MEPGGRRPAPGALALVQGFINTRDIEASTDALDSQERLREWFVAHDLAAATIALDETGLDRARELRESLRALLEGNHDAATSATALAVFNELSGRIPLCIQAGDRGFPFLAAVGDGIDRPLGRLLAIVHAAAIDGTWSRLKVCPSDICRWAFYDHSKNRSSTWCTMSVCGNRSKVRAYQQRRRASR